MYVAQGSCIKGHVAVIIYGLNLKEFLKQKFSTGGALEGSLKCHVYKCVYLSHDSFTCPIFSRFTYGDIAFKGIKVIICGGAGPSLL